MATRLHSVVLNHRRFELQHLLATITELDPTIQDEHGKTALHYAVICSNSSLALQMVTTLIDCKQMKTDVVVTRDGLQSTKKSEKVDTQRLRDFVNIQDNNGESAVHLAASKWRHDIVHILITKCGADLSLRSNTGKTARRLVFANVPKAMEKILSTRIFFPRKKINLPRTTITLDLRDIVDIPQSDYGTNESSIETRALATAFDLRYNKNLGILTHPLIRTFLALKWNRMKVYIYSAMLCKMFLLLIYNYFTHHFYVTKCPFQDRRSPTTNGTKSNKGAWDMESPQCGPPNFQDSALGCTDTGGAVSILFGILLVIGSLPMFMKEAYKMYRLRTLSYYMFSGTILVNFLFIPAVVTTVIPILFAHKQIEAWYYQAAAVGVLISWTIFLIEMRNIPFWGIGKYVEIFGKVIKRFVKLLLIFLLLLNAFLLSFGMIMPRVSKFFFPVGILKILVMMTGEIDFDELFYDSNEVPNAFQLMTQILYAMFVVLVSIMLVNLLIGFTVSDVAELRRAALENQLYKKLEHIHYLETLLFDFTKISDCFERRYKELRVIPPKHLTKKITTVQVYMDIVPPKLQQKLRKLAFLNMDKYDDLEIPDTEGVTWVKAKNGFVPEDTVLSSYLDGYEELYVTRVKHGKNVIPGKLRKTLRVTFYPWGGSEHCTNNYEVLTADPGSVSWIDCNSKDEIPKSAIQAGITEEGEILYVGQGRTDSGACGIGRVDYSDRILSIPYGGAEVYCEQYQILVKR